MNTPIKKTKVKGKGIEFNPTVAIAFILAILLTCTGGYFLMNLSNEDFVETPTPRVMVDMGGVSPVSAAAGLDTPTPKPTVTPFPTVTPTPYLIFSSECLIYDYPSIDEAQPVGRYLEGSLIVPLGIWSDWFEISSGWVPRSCLTGKAVELPLVSPPMMAVVSTFTPVPMVTPTVTSVSVVRSVRPTSTPKPKYLFTSLPDGFQPGWCGKVIGVKAVWLPDNNVISPGDDGAIYLSSEALGLQVVYEKSSWFGDFLFDRCGQYVVN